ncbi:MAG: methyltransferase domain-containing protein [Oxalobacter sp.]
MHPCSDKVRQLFENLPRTAENGFLWQESSSRLRDRLSVMNVTVDRFIDVGCGQGRDLVWLRKQFPQSSAVGMDGAFLPVRQAFRENNDPKTGCICGNTETMMFLPETFNLVWSNMMLHWAEDIGAVLSCWYQMLRQNGLLLFSCLGYGSLHNLYHAFEGIDGYGHIMTFPDCQQLGAALVQSGFPSPVLEREWIDLTYQETDTLLHDIRALGGNPLADRRQGLMGKGTFTRLLQNLEALRDEAGQITLRFEIIFCHAFKENLPKKKLDAGQEMPIGFFRGLEKTFTEGRE